MFIYVHKCPTCRVFNHDLHASTLHNTIVGECWRRFFQRPGDAYCYVLPIQMEQFTRVAAWSSWGISALCCSQSSMTPGCKLRSSMQRLGDRTWYSTTELLHQYKELRSSADGSNDLHLHAIMISYEHRFTIWPSFKKPGIKKSGKSIWVVWF